MHRVGAGSPDEIRVLYVDDDEGLLSLTKEFLETEREAIDIETVTGPETALDRLDDETFDVVVSDYQMPGMDGLEFLEVLRDERNDDIPFIIFTGQGREEVAIEALNIGADRYLQKGGDPTSQYGVLAQAIEQEVEHYRTNRQLRKRERHLRITLDSIGDAVIATDDEGVIERMNDVAEEITGWDSEAAIGKPLTDVFEIINHETRQPAENPVDQVLETGQTVGLANGTILVDKTGDERFIADSAAPIERENGDVIGVVLVFRDVTEEYETRHRQERQQDALIDLATDPTVIDGDFEGACRRITERAAEVLDVERASVWLFDDDGTTLACRDLYQRDVDEHGAGAVLDAEEYPQYFRALEAHRAVDAPDVYDDDRTAELTPYFESNDICSLLDGTIRAEGDVIGVLCCETVGEAREWEDDEIRFAAEMADQVHQAFLNRDRQNHRQNLTRKSRRLETLIEQSPLAIIEWTLDFHVSTWNAQAETLFGYTESEAKGRHGSFIVPPDVRDDIGGIWADLADEGAHDHRINENVTKGGETITCEWHNRPVTNDDGEVVSVLSLVRDVTDERRQSRQLRALIENTKEAVYIKDTDGRYEFINEAGAAYFDMDPEEIVGRYDGDLFDLDGDRRMLRADQEVIGTEEPQQFERTRHIGGERYVFLTEKRPHYDENGHLRGLIGISRDITERRRIEELLEAFYDLATDTDLSFDDRVERLLETLRSELSVDTALLTREGADGSLEVISSAGSGPLGSADDPDTLPRMFCARVLDDDAPHVIEDASEEVDGERPYQEYGITRYIGAPIHVEEETWGTLCLVGAEPQDDPVSETELTLLELAAEWLGQEITRWEHERDLRHQNEALEDIVSVLSHDLQTPLSVAKGRIDLAADDPEEGHIEEARRTLDNLEELVEDVLTLAEQGWEIDDSREVSLASSSRQAWSNVDPDGATLDVRDDGTLVANERGLLSVLQNLFENAVTHSENGVTVGVGTTDDSCGFYVADDGPGIPPDEREAVLEHGYTTSDDGSGLGLTIVQRIAHAHDWSITVTESEAGGTRFEFHSQGLLGD